MENVIAYFTLIAGTCRAAQYDWFMGAANHGLEVYDIADTICAAYRTDYDTTVLLVRSYLDIIERAYNERVDNAA